MTKICEICGKEYTARGNSKYCPPCSDWRNYQNHLKHENERRKRRRAEQRQAKLGPMNSLWEETS